MRAHGCCAGLWLWPSRLLVLLLTAQKAQLTAQKAHQQQELEVSGTIWGMPERPVRALRLLVESPAPPSPRQSLIIFFQQKVPLVTGLDFLFGFFVCCLACSYSVFYSFLVSYLFILTRQWLSCTFEPCKQNEITAKSEENQMLVALSQCQAREKNIAPSS